MIKAKATAKKLELNIHVDEKLPSKLLGDDVRIRQVLVNLLNNAVKYTQEGCVTLTVSGRVEGRKAIIDFAVEDNNFIFIKIVLLYSTKKLLFSSGISSRF